MTTSYPTTLPPVPADRWDARVTGNSGDPDEGSAFLTLVVTATSAAEAEQRALAYLDHDYEDDLRGASAEALGHTGPDDPTPSAWTVRINLARPR